MQSCNKYKQSVQGSQAMKGTASVNPIFQSFSVRNSTIFSIQPLIFADSHNIYFRNTSVSRRMEPKSIINTLHSPQLGVVMILTEDGRLRVYSESLDEIAAIPWESKYSLGFQMLKSGAFLMIGATELELQYTKIQSNVKSTKFVSSMNFLIEKREKYVAEPHTKLQWNKGYNLNEQCNLLYIWSSKDVNFYSLDKLQIKSHAISVTRKELSITYVYFNPQYKYTVTGLVNGHVKVWRLPLNTVRPSPKDYIMIHNFTQHAKPVDKIVQGNDQRIIISSSTEMIVCFSSLETFELLRQYDFLGEYSTIVLHSHLFSLAVQNGELGILRFGKNLEFITDLTSDIINFDKYYEQLDFEKGGKIGSIQITLGSNLGFQIQEESLNAKDLNKIEIEHIYPPLKAKGIQQILSSPYQRNQYYLLVENGEIFRLRIEDGSGKIEESYSIERAKDIEMHQLNQIPCLMKFLAVVPPQFDSEINENSLEKKNSEKNSALSEEEILTKYRELQLIAIGCNKGTIVFFRATNFESIYTRITYHRQEIKFMQSFRSQGYFYIASYCAENFLKIVKLDNENEKAECILSVSAGTILTGMKGFEDRLALIFRKGFFEVFEFDGEGRDFCHGNTDCMDHEEDVLSIDCDARQKLLLTAAADNKIKVWTYYKILIYEVDLDDGLKCAIWFRPMEMLVSHNFKILYFKNIGLGALSLQELEDINREFIEQCQEVQTIKSSIQAMNRFQDQESNEKYRLSSVKVVEDRRNTGGSPIKKGKGKTEEVSPKKRSRVSRNEIKQEFKNQDMPATKSKVRKRGDFKQKKSMSVADEPGPKEHIPESDLEAMRKHVNEIRSIRRKTNEPILPKIGPRAEDSFESFMKLKLINKKTLTRRNITLNRIIMKNIIKEHFGSETDISNNLKLDF